MVCHKCLCVRLSGFQEAGVCCCCFFFCGGAAPSGESSSLALTCDTFPVVTVEAELLKTPSVKVLSR